MGHDLFYVYPSFANAEKIGASSGRRSKDIFGKVFKVFFNFLRNISVCLFSTLVLEREIDWI